MPSTCFVKSIRLLSSLLSFSLDIDFTPSKEVRVYGLGKERVQCLTDEIIQCPSNLKLFEDDKLKSVQMIWFACGSEKHCGKKTTWLKYFLLFPRYFNSLFRWFFKLWGYAERVKHTRFQPQRLPVIQLLIIFSCPS